jgi:hypothetical protein
MDQEVHMARMGKQGKQAMPFVTASGYSGHRRAQASQTGLLQRSQVRGVSAAHL